MHFHGPIVRPPVDADSVFVELTVGCTHSGCTFCNFYDGYPFRMAEWQDIEADFKEAAHRWPGASKIWASGGNPFALSTEKLLRFADFARIYLPRAVIKTYARVDDIVRKSPEELRQLRKAGYDDLVLGLESGDDEILAFVQKGYSAKDILEACWKLEEAGFSYRTIYLGGLAGHGNVKASVEKTLSIFNQIHPYFMFLTTVAILPGTKLYEQMQAGVFQEETERDRIMEFRDLVKGLKHPLTVFAQSVTNMVSFTVDLPQDRTQIVAELDRVIDSLSDERAIKMHQHRARLRAV